MFLWVIFICSSLIKIYIFVMVYVTKYGICNKIVVHILWSYLLSTWDRGHKFVSQDKFCEQQPISLPISLAIFQMSSWRLVCMIEHTIWLLCYVVIFYISHCSFGISSCPTDHLCVQWNRYCVCTCYVEVHSAICWSDRCTKFIFMLMMIKVLTCIKHVRSDVFEDNYSLGMIFIGLKEKNVCVM